MKHFLKSIQILSVLSIIVLTNISTNKSNWSSINLSADEMEHSVKFQLSRGGNCKGEFEKLTPVLDRFIKNSYTSQKLTKILGEPNSLSTPNNSKNYTYYLSTSTNNCLLVLTIEDDKLIQYNIEKCN